MTKKEAHRLRRKGEIVVERTLHDPEICLAAGDPPNGIPAATCSCGGRGKGYFLVWDSRKGRG